MSGAMPIAKPSLSGVPGRRPTGDETRALYDAHQEYAAVHPWETLPNDRPLVIHNTLRRQTGYLALHRDGATYYQGNRGLLHYLRADVAAPNMGECVTLFYRHTGLINSREVARLEDLGISASPNGNWPLFRSIMPYHMEWPPSAEQSQAMAYALRQAALAAEHIRRTGSPSLSRDPELPAAAPIWTTYPNAPGKLEWMALPGLDQLGPRHPNYEPDLTSSAGEQPATGETWSMCPIALPFPLYESAYQEARPQYPVAVTVATQGAGSKRLTLLDLHRHAVDRDQSVFLQAVLMLERRPVVVLVSHPMTADALRPLEKDLGFHTRVASDIPFYYEDIRPIVEEMQRTVLRDNRHTHAAPPLPLAPQDRKDMPGCELDDPLTRRHTAAALTNGLYHNPARDVTPPENLASQDYFAPDMTPAQALWTMAAVNGGWANLEIAARMFAEAGGVPGDEAGEAAMRLELRKVVDADDAWEMTDHGAAYSARAAAETELPERRRWPEPEPEPRRTNRRGPRSRTPDPPLAPVPGLSAGMRAFEALEAIADARGPEVDIREVSQQLIAAGISRSQDPERVAVNVRAIIRKRPDWRMIGGGRARREPPSEKSE